MIIARDYQLVVLLSVLIGMAYGIPDQYFRVKYDDYYDDTEKYDFDGFEIQPPDSALIASLVNIGLKAAESFELSSISEKKDTLRKTEPKVVNLIE